MATFNTIWSVDLGKSSLKAVKLHRERNNIEILAIDKIDYPIGSNGVDTVQHAREALNAFKLRNEVREPVVVAHPGQGTFSRFIKVPAFEAKKLKEMVGYEASQQIPFPLDEVIWDYHLVGREYLAGEEREVGIFAVRKEAIDDYLLDFTSNGLSVEVLSIGYLGLLNYIFYDLAPQEPSIVLDIGATHTDLILVDGKKFWIRALPHSGNDINKAIMDRFKVSFQEAENLKIESSKAPQQAAKIFSAVIQPKLKELVGEIHRSVGYYRSQAGEVKFQNLYLLGNGSRVVGIKKYLAEQLGLQVHRVQTLRHFRVNRDVDLKLLQSELPAFGTAFGCALQGVGAGSCRVDLVPQEERLQKEIRRKRKHAYIAMAAVYLAIIGAYFILAGKIDTARQEAETHARFIRNDIQKFANNPKKAGPRAPDPKELEKRGLEMLSLAEARRLALDALRVLGVVVPKENAAPLVKRGSEKQQESLTSEAKQELFEFNKRRALVPWIRVERVHWPEDPAGAQRKTQEKKAVPTVPAYKVTMFGAVVAQDDPQKSLELLRTVLVTPLEEKLKASPDLTIDPQVRVASTDKPSIERLPTGPTINVGGAIVRGEERRSGRQKQDERPQLAGPFYGTELTWYLRLKDPPKEEAPAAAAPAEEPEERGTGKQGKRPK